MLSTTPVPVQAVHVCEPDGNLWMRIWGGPTSERSQRMEGGGERLKSAARNADDAPTKLAVSSQKKAVRYRTVRSYYQYRTLESSSTAVLKYTVPETLFER